MTMELWRARRRGRAGAVVAVAFGLCRVDGFITPPVVPALVPAQTRVTAWCQGTGPAATSRRRRLVMTAEGSDDERPETNNIRAGLVNREFDMLLDEEGNAKECVKLMRSAGPLLSFDMPKGARLLDRVSAQVLKESYEEKDPAGDMTFVYGALKSVGLLRGYGSVDMARLPSKQRNISPELLQSLTGLPMQSLAPGRPTNYWLLAGVAICGLEYVVGNSLGMDPVATTLPWTIAALMADKFLLGDAVSESVIRTLVPGYFSRIIKHEAGHFLLAYLLGCPVQGCLLDPWEVGKVVGGQAGTVFADPEFTKGMVSGRLTRSMIDRFSIVLMGGIAAEAIQCDRAEGGLADEELLISILSQTVPPFNLEQIRDQARWAAAQAVLILREHQEEYDALVVALEGGKSLGESVAAIEVELAGKVVPGERFTPAQQVPLSPADEVRRLLGERLAQVDLAADMAIGPAGEGFTGSASSPMTTAAGGGVVSNELRAKLEGLEKALESGQPLPSDLSPPESVKGGGVWLRDLQSVRDATSPTSPASRSPKPPSPEPAATVDVDPNARLKELEALAEANKARLADVEGRLQGIPSTQVSAPSWPPASSSSSSSSPSSPPIASSCSPPPPPAPTPSAAAASEQATMVAVAETGGAETGGAQPDPQAQSGQGVSRLAEAPRAPVAAVGGGEAPGGAEARLAELDVMAEANARRLAELEDRIRDMEQVSE